MNTQDKQLVGSNKMIKGLAALALAFAAMMFAYKSGLFYMAGEWAQEHYSHGPLIPLIAGFLFFRIRKDLFAEPWQGAWIGLLMVLGSSLIFLMGELSALYVLIQYAFLGTLVGLVFSLIGWRGMKYAWAPLLYLAFMIPLPDFLYNNLSAKLQLISSEMGVAVIRAFGISVFLEGNVIDLGSMQLQVVEACAGLRYLFPLMSFGFLLAYLFEAPLWQRTLVFLATMPITVYMNSFRIGVIGVLVDKFGEEQAQGFIHDFEGWVIFMVCVILLLLMMKLLMLFSGDKRSLRDSFGIDLGPDVEKQQINSSTVFRTPFFACVGLIVAVAVGTLYLDERTEVIPERERFSSFDLEIGDWKGRQTTIEQVYLDTLKLDDYLSAQFYDDEAGDTVDVWVAYYSTQRKGVAIHSPKTCLPGGGWTIEEFDQVNIGDIPEAEGNQVAVNRAIMSYDKSRTLIYYWFKQRERNITSEYALKWYLFQDSLTRQRTDGALMRLIINVPDASQLEEKELILQDFLRDSYSRLVDSVPD